ncbi:hypothetical protein KO465_03930 [Candidatus Micrarchaeota archaeon]|nr:hypothetical protein [Candidatus Micrarchaeota archaeon]
MAPALKPTSENETKIIQTSKGVYGFENKTIIPTSKKLLLVVHPYFVFEEPGKKGIKEDNEYWSGKIRSTRYYKKYKSNLEKLISDPERIVLTFECSDEIFKTADRYRKVGKTENAYFMGWEGIPYSPPDDLSWVDVALYMYSLYYETGDEKNEMIVDAAGGFLIEEEGVCLRGCLGGAIEILKKYSLKFNIIKEAVF